MTASAESPRAALREAQRHMQAMMDGGVVYGDPWSALTKAIEAVLAAPEPVCPHVRTSKEGTSFCALAESDPTREDAALLKRAADFIGTKIDPDDRRDGKFREAFLRDYAALPAAPPHVTHDLDEVARACFPPQGSAPPEPGSRDLVSRAKVLAIYDQAFGRAEFRAAIAALPPEAQGLRDELARREVEDRAAPARLTEPERYAIETLGGICRWQVEQYEQSTDEEERRLIPIWRTRLDVLQRLTASAGPDAAPAHGPGTVHAQLEAVYDWVRAHQRDPADDFSSSLSIAERLDTILAEAPARLLTPEERDAMEWAIARCTEEVVEFTRYEAAELKRGGWVAAPQWRTRLAALQRIASAAPPDAGTQP